MDDRRHPSMGSPCCGIASSEPTGPARRAKARHIVKMAFAKISRTERSESLFRRNKLPKYSDPEDWGRIAGWRCARRRESSREQFQDFIGQALFTASMSSSPSTASTRPRDDMSRRLTGACWAGPTDSISSSTKKRVTSVHAGDGKPAPHGLRVEGALEIRLRLDDRRRWPAARSAARPRRPWRSSTRQERRDAAPAASRRSFPRYWPNWKTRVQIVRLTRRSCCKTWPGGGQRQRGW